MKRRHFVVGLGGVAGGGSLIVGSGAFSAAEVRRDFDANIVDSEGEAFASGDFPEDDTVEVSTYDIDGDWVEKGESVADTTPGEQHSDAMAARWDGPVDAEADTYDLEGDPQSRSGSSLKPAYTSENGGQSGGAEYNAVVDSDDDPGMMSTDSSRGLISIKNRIPAEITTDLSTDCEYLECTPDGDLRVDTDAVTTIAAGERVDFNALADCNEVKDDGEVVDFVAHLDRSDDESVSASIQREIEVSRRVVVAVTFGCTDARVDLATDPGQSGEHLDATPPIDLTATLADDSDTHTETATIRGIDELPWTPETSYDKVERLEIDGRKEGEEYTFDNTLTQVKEDGSHSHWECNKNWTSETV